MHLGQFSSDCFYLVKTRFCHYFQTAILLLRIDDIVSGTKKSEGREGTQSGAQPTDASIAE